ncbi:DUF4468 domain-containing protein [Empedobacter sp. R132-2]|uniref:DUF4468 domain-containing protein n=1 Tax=Empedobacter sp. R132-2 TaxID=2746740 RepID=UPI002576C3DD|nr:DUF4468 domain-containing protein [Empedobacter sp. R132-2]MDM1138884.1 DUF4468 domain-containing protein [Empedobacter sp. R132-2]
MRYILLLLMLVSININAQSFRLNSSGFVNSEDNTKDYVVLDFPNQSQSELFSKAMIFVTKYYKSAKDVISKVDNETISINAISSHDIPRNSIHYYQNRYIIVLSFKDGKIKVDAPNVSLTRYTDGQLRTLYIYREKGDILEYNLGIFGKNEKLRYPKSKEALESFANRFLDDLKKNILGDSSTNDDW